MLDEMAREGMYAIELNDKLSLKLADKVRFFFLFLASFFAARALRWRAVTCGLAFRSREANGVSTKGVPANP